MVGGSESHITLDNTAEIRISEFFPKTAVKIIRLEYKNVYLKARMSRHSAFIYGAHAVPNTFFDVSLRFLVDVWGNFFSVTFLHCSSEPVCSCDCAFKWRVMRRDKIESECSLLKYLKYATFMRVTVSYVQSQRQHNAFVFTYIHNITVRLIDEYSCICFVAYVFKLLSSVIGKLRKIQNHLCKNVFSFWL